MNESRLLEEIERRSRELSGRGVVVRGPGDDCAVLDLTAGTLITVDHLVAGRHFDAGRCTVGEIGRKAVARSVSDIAAMGGTPLVGLATGCLPHGYAEGGALFESMSEWALRWGCPLAGGDISTSDGPMVLTVTVLGSSHGARGPVYRDGARVGDAVYVSGRVGGAVRSGRHQTFEPRVVEGRWLCSALGAGLHAMIDISDGAGRDGGRVARASGVRIELEASRLPLHADACGWREAVREGEDYELLFCVGEGVMVPACCPETGTPMTRIGRVVAGSGCVVIEPGGAEFDASAMGWEHD